MNENHKPKDPSELEAAATMTMASEASPAEPPAEVPVAAVPEAPTTPPPVPTAPTVNEPTYTLGQYKRLDRATRFNIDGLDRPLFGKAVFGYTPYKKRDEDTNGRTPISMPSLGFAGIAHANEAIQRLNFRDDAQAREWAGTIDQSNSLNPVNDAFIGAMNREGSEWQQVPMYGEKPLVAAMASQPAHQNKELKDSQAIMYAMGALGLGSPAQAPMWHSGFWVSFRPASEDAWVNFNDRITADKIRIGRNSSGLSFSNINAIYTERALELALEHMLDHNIRMEATTSRRDIFKKLKTGDIPSFLWAFLMANNPNGYPITRACSAAIGNCTEVIKETLNLRILQVTDISVLEERHRAHMAKNKTNGVTEKEVDDYQATLLPIQPREITVLDSEKLTLRAVLAMPSAEDYILSGHRWFDGIVDMVNGIISKEATGQQREQTYQSYAKASIMREYSHWVKEIHLDSNVVKDLATLEKLLTDLTPHSTLRKKFYERISEYIESSSMSVVAIPNYACEKCGEVQYETKEGSRFIDCIPLDVAEAFFNLALLRMLEITNR